MSGKEYTILVINPGSTSTKISVFKNDKEILNKNIQHSKSELEPFGRIWEQYEFRTKLIIKFLEENNIALSSLDAVVGRGGLFRPIVSGIYEVNQAMLEDAKNNFGGEHASNLGCVLSSGIAQKLGIPAFIADPPSVDELCRIARYSGLPEFPRNSIFHALNVKATARLAARELGKNLNEINLIVAHLGGGISVAALEKGRVIDCNNALYTGPFTPERSGTLPMFDFAEWCFSGKSTLAQVKKRLVGGGGLVAYLNTNNCQEVEERIAKGDKEAENVYNAMIYQIACEIGSRAVVLKGKIDAIVITGGLANSKTLVNKLKEWVSFLGKVLIYPGEDEMKALASTALRVLKGEEKAKIYPEEARND